MSEENNKKEEAAKRALESKDAINRPSIPESKEEVSNMEAVIDENGLGKVSMGSFTPPNPVMQPESLPPMMFRQHRLNILRTWYTIPN